MTMLLVLNLSRIELDIVILSFVSVYIVRFDFENSSSVHLTCLLASCPSMFSLALSADLYSYLTVCSVWYSASICQLVHIIYLNNEWDCTFWSDYLQRHPIVALYVCVLRVDGRSMPFSFILLNNILTVCLNME